jgi:hypothetical protein
LLGVRPMSKKAWRHLLKKENRSSRGDSQRH